MVNINHHRFSLSLSFWRPIFDTMLHNGNTMKRPLTEHFTLALLNNASIDLIVDLLSVDYHGWIARVERQRKKDYWSSSSFAPLFSVYCSSLPSIELLFAVDKFFRLFCFPEIEHIVYTQSVWIVQTLCFR